MYNNNELSPNSNPCARLLPFNNTYIIRTIIPKNTWNLNVERTSSFINHLPRNCRQKVVHNVLGKDNATRDGGYICDNMFVSLHSKCTWNHR